MCIFNFQKNTLNSCMIFVDFSEYGLDDFFYPVEPEELCAIGAGAQQMIERYEASVCELMLVGWEIDLLRQARRHNGCVPDQWFTRALLCIAIRGYRGDVAPRFCEHPAFR
jgi:hypothetical protein